MLGAIDQRARLRWGVQADGELIAAFVWKERAEQFAALGRRDTPTRRRIEVVFLGAVLAPRTVSFEDRTVSDGDRLPDPPMP